MAPVPLGASLIGLFVVAQDLTAVNIALPTIRAHFGGTLASQQWILNGYMLMFGAFLLTAGALSDRVGARRAFAIGLASFALMSLVCAAAPNMTVLIVARFAQGLAAAVVAPSSMSLLRENHHDPVSRTRAVALWSSGGGLAVSCGPVLGGVLAALDWRLVFLATLPASLTGLVLTWKVAPSPMRSVEFGWPGQVAALVSMVALTYAAIGAGASGLTSLPVLAAAALAVGGFVVFVLVQARSAHPMLPLPVLRSPVVLVPVAVGFAFMVAFYGTCFVLSLYLQEAKGLSPLQAATVFLPMMVMSAVVNLFVARLVRWFGSRSLVVGGQALMAVALVWLATQVTSASGSSLAWLMLPLGLAASLFMPPVVVVLLNSVPGDLAGTVSGVFNTGRQLGGVLAIAVFGILLGPGVNGDGVRSSLFVAAGLVALTAVLALRLEPGGHGRLTDGGALVTGDDAFVTSDQQIDTASNV